MDLPRAKAKRPLFLRQPPPPPSIRRRRHTSSVSTKRTFEEANNSKMADGSEESNCSHVAPQTRPYYFKRCKRKMLKTTNLHVDSQTQTRPYYFRRCRRKMLKTTKIEYLPDELILEILVRVPAEDIYNATRFVCRKWYKMIHTHNFVHAHLQQQTHGLFVQHAGNDTLIAKGKDLIETFKLNFKFREEIKSSCNGLVLETGSYSHYLHVTNPVTKQQYDLPPFLKDAAAYGYAIAYVAASMEYKVVRSLLANADASVARKSSSDYFVPQYDCVAVLTVGVDKDWTRRVRTQHLSPQAMKLLFSYNRRPLTTEGFVHWVRNGFSKYVVTLNVETEIITQFPVPPLPHLDGDTRLMYRYLPMGSYLSLLVNVTRFSWEAWEMKPDTGEWTKMPNIDLEPQFARTLDCILTPLGWLKFGEVLIFSVRRGASIVNSLPTQFCIAYNLRTHELESFELALTPSLHSFLVHRSSLVWIDGC